MSESPRNRFFAVLSVVALVLLFSASFVQQNSSVQSARAISPQTELPPPHITGYTSGAPGYCLSKSVCSEGLTDYGIRSNGHTYSYEAVAVNSSVAFDNLTLGKGNDGYDGISLQQNSVAWNVLEYKSYGEYWIQDVVDIFQSGSTYQVEVFNNIWNFSNDKACCMTGKVYGCGGVYSNETYYGCSGPTFKTKLPVTVVLGDNASLNTENSESSCIGFLYQVWHGTKELGSGRWDKVCFASDFKASGAPYYKIGQFNPYTYNALQIAIGGWCCGYTGQVKGIFASMKLMYEKSNDSWISVPHAWSECDTGETVTGVKMYLGGTDIGNATHGTDDQVQLW